MKGEYREVATGSDDSQNVKMSLDTRLGYLGAQTRSLNAGAAETETGTANFTDPRQRDAYADLTFDRQNGMPGVGFRLRGQGLGALPPAGLTPTPAVPRPLDEPPPRVRYPELFNF